MISRLEIRLNPNVKSENSDRAPAIVIAPAGALNSSDATPVFGNPA
jgi:hypothetical protein